MRTSVVEKSVPELSDIEWRSALVRASRSLSPPPSLRVADSRVTADPATVSSERRQLASAEIRDLSGILKQLVELLSQPERDEYGQLRPTKNTFDTAYALLVDTAIVSASQSRPIPYGRVSTDSEGGVRIEWVRPTTSVHLVVPASADAYIYHEVGNAYDVDLAAPESLAHWLRTID